MVCSAVCRVAVIRKGHCGLGTRPSKTRTIGVQARVGPMS
jgi:hypothetical protein